MQNFWEKKFEKNIEYNLGKEPKVSFYNLNEVCYSRAISRSFLESTEIFGLVSLIIFALQTWGNFDCKKSGKVSVKFFVEKHFEKKYSFSTVTKTFKKQFFSPKHTVKHPVISGCLPCFPEGEKLLGFSCKRPYFFLKGN